MRRCLMILILALTVSACGGNTSATPTSTELANQVDVTPDRLEATPIGLNLSENAASTDRSVTVNYPEGWSSVSQTGNTIYLSDQELLPEDVGVDSAPADGVLMVVSTLTRDQITDSNMSITEMAQSLGTGLSAASGGPEFGDAAEGNINGYPSVTLTGVIERDGGRFDTQIVVIDRREENYLVQVVLLTGEGQSEAYEELTREIAASVQVQAGAVATDDMNMDTTPNTADVPDSLGGTTPEGAEDDTTEEADGDATDAPGTSAAPGVTATP